MKKVDVYWAPKTWSREGVIKRDGGICGYCLSRNGDTVDHILAKDLGGKGEWLNTMACCLKCNGAKSNMTLEAWGKPILHDMSKERAIPKQMYYRSEFSRRKRKKNH